MLSAQNLTRRYGDLVAVDDVSFDLVSGEVVGLLGHNAAGKTTIAKLLTGFIEPSSGRALVEDIDVLEQPDKARALMGYLPETRSLYTEMTVAEYLLFTARVRGIPKAEQAERVRETISATDLKQRALNHIGTLSRGFQQRVGVAQAILHKPKVLILDEPTNGLDPFQTQHMRELIKSLAENATVILSTHIMQEVDAICDRVLIMNSGKLVVDEKLTDLKQGSRFWVGTPADLQRVTEAVAGRAQVEAGDGGVFLSITAVDVRETVNALMRSFVASGIPVYEVSRERRDLEALFREVSEVKKDAA